MSESISDSQSVVCVGRRDSGGKGFLDTDILPERFINRCRICTAVLQWLWICLRIIVRNLPLSWGQTVQTTEVRAGLQYCKTINTRIFNNSMTLKSTHLSHQQVVIHPYWYWQRWLLVKTRRNDKSNWSRVCFESQLWRSPNVQHSLNAQRPINLQIVDNMDQCHFPTTCTNTAPSYTVQTSTFYPPIRTRNTEDVSLQPLCIGICFSGDLPRHLVRGVVVLLLPSPSK